MYMEPSLDKYYLKTHSIDTLEERREFLEKIIQLEAIRENNEVKYYKLKVMNFKNDLDVKKVIENYLEILNKEIANTYTVKINNIYETLKNERDKYEKELKEIELEVEKVLLKEPKELWANDQAWEIVQTKHSRLFENQNKVRELYNKHNDKVTGIEGIKESRELNEQARKISSIYKIKQKSKAKMVALIGLFLGMILGVMSAFLKEFWVEFKNEVNRR